MEAVEAPSFNYRSTPCYHAKSKVLVAISFVSAMLLWPGLLMCDGDVL